MPINALWRSPEGHLKAKGCVWKQKGIWQERTLRARVVISGGSASADHQRLWGGQVRFGGHKVERVNS